MDTFSAKMVYKRVRGWISGGGGGSLPVLNFVNLTPPPRTQGGTKSLQYGAKRQQYYLLRFLKFSQKYKEIETG